MTTNRGNGARRRSKHSKQAKRQPHLPGTSRNGVDYTLATKFGCSTGKWAWPLDAGGRKGAKTLARALRNSGGKAVRPYECPECHRYHVGHIPFEARKGHRSANDIYDNRK